MFDNLDDEFIPKICVDSVNVHTQAMSEVCRDVILESKEIPEMHKEYLQLSRVLKRLLKGIAKVNKTILTKPPEALAGRREGTCHAMSTCAQPGQRESQDRDNAGRRADNS